MNESMVIQGRTVTSAEIQLIRQLLAENPAWHRKRLSIELCKIWDWCALNGQYKDMACRNFLLKLHRHGQITLPPPLNVVNNAVRHQALQYVLHQKSPIVCELEALTPIHVTPVQNAAHDSLFKTFLSPYHYLGYSGTVGENIKYIAFDRDAMFRTWRVTFSGVSLVGSVPTGKKNTRIPFTGSKRS